MGALRTVGGGGSGILIWFSSSPVRWLTPAWLLLAIRVDSPIYVTTDSHTPKM